MSRKTKFLAILGVALVTAGILELAVGDKYQAYREKNCTRWHHRIADWQNAPAQKPGK